MEPLVISGLRWQPKWQCCTSGIKLHSITIRMEADRTQQWMQSTSTAWNTWNNKYTKLNYFNLFIIKVWKPEPLILWGFKCSTKACNRRGHMAHVTHLLLEKDDITSHKTYITNKGHSSVTLQCHYTWHSSSVTATQSRTHASGPSSSTLSSLLSLILWGWCPHFPLHLPWQIFLLYYHCLHVCLPQEVLRFLRSTNVVFHLHVPRFQQHPGFTHHSLPVRRMMTNLKQNKDFLAKFSSLSSAEQEWCCFDSSHFCWTRVNKDLVHSNKALN